MDQLDVVKTLGFALASKQLRDGIYRAEACTNNGGCFRFWFRISNSELATIYVKYVNGDTAIELEPFEIRYALLHLLALDIDNVHRLNFDIRDVGWYAPTKEDLVFALRCFKEISRAST